MSTHMSSDSNSKYVDLHSHLQFDDFDADREEVIQNMIENDVITINVGTTIESSVDGLELAKKYPEVCYATVGLHPVYVDEAKEESNLENIITENAGTQLVGIGECGMDFFRSKPEDIDNIQQEKVFEDQIRLALKYDLPLMLHVRDSYQKTLSILSKYFKKGEVQYRGNAHFFVGTIEEAKAFLDLGFSISFTGVITFVKAYEDLVRFVPLDRMFAETDSPYVSPIPHRGKRNNPVHVIDIYKKIAEIKQIPLQVVKDTLYANACAFWLKDRSLDSIA